MRVTATPAVRRECSAQCLPQRAIGSPPAHRSLAYVARARRAGRHPRPDRAGSRLSRMVTQHEGGLIDVPYSPRLCFWLRTAAGVRSLNDSRSSVTVLPVRTASAICHTGSLVPAMRGRPPTTPSRRTMCGYSVSMSDSPRTGAVGVEAIVRIGYQAVSLGTHGSGYRWLVSGQPVIRMCGLRRAGLGMGDRLGRGDSVRRGDSL